MCRQPKVQYDVEPLRDDLREGISCGTRSKCPAARSACGEARRACHAAARAPARRAFGTSVTALLAQRQAVTRALSQAREPLFQQVPLRVIDRQCQCLAQRDRRLVQPVEPDEELGAGGRQQCVPR